MVVNRLWGKSWGLFGGNPEDFFPVQLAASGDSISEINLMLKGALGAGFGWYAHGRT